jgi:branched-subunit amino acid aminotransferase/4-amino-4-deoxychorismate lyase
MSVIFNFQLLPTMPVISADNRAFNYGDGFFETMYFNGEQISGLSYHIKRFKKTASKLRLEIEAGLNQQYLDLASQELTGKLNIKTARIKLIVFRKAGGLYTPDQNETDFLILAQPADFSTSVLSKAGFSEKLYTHKTALSKYKTLNRLNDVLLALENKQRKTDIIIATDKKGHISQAIASNIFWKKGDTYFTPLLKTGCISGTMRSRIIDILHERSIPLKKVMADKKELLQADQIFVCNALSIRYIKKLEKKEFDTSPEKLENWLDII